MIKEEWGFDAMSNEVNVRYIKYITARLASFRNVWWSMANEWDYVKSENCGRLEAVDEKQWLRMILIAIYVLFMERRLLILIIGCLNLPMSAYKMRHRY